MEPSDLSLEILKTLRDELRGHIAHTEERFDRTDSRLDSVRDELLRRIVESEVRTATAITDLAGVVRELTSTFRSQAELRPRVERCEHEIDELQRRLAATGR